MIVSFQGAKGAFSDLAARACFPEAQTVACGSFEDAFLSVEEKTADFAVIPIDNTLAGRVADVHHLMKESTLHIIGEYFLPIEHCLLGVKGANLKGLTDVYSHIHALPQCRKVIKELQLNAHVYADTAAAAQKIAQDGLHHQCAIASRLAAEIYDLDILKEGIQDKARNTTRFIVLTRKDVTDIPNITESCAKEKVTSFLFQTRNLPAALYKALGGFATNGVNMTKLESYIGDAFEAAYFYCDVLGDVEDQAMINAFEELSFFVKEYRVLGCYPSHEYRLKQNA